MADKNDIPNQLQGSLDQARNQQIGAIADALGNAFPKSAGIAGTAGGATGTYLSLIGPDGNPYKIALLSP